MKSGFIKKVVVTTLVSVLVIGFVVFISQAKNNVNKDVNPINETIPGTILSAELDRDTPEDVQVASKNSAAALKELKVAIDEANNVFEKISNDKAYASKLLTLAKSKDKAGIISLIKKDAPKSEVEIVEIRDWTATFAFKVRGRKVTVCGSSDNGCGGNTASVSVS